MDELFVDECISIIVIDNQENYANALNDYIDICNYIGKFQVKLESNIKEAIKEISKKPNCIVVLDAYVGKEKSIKFLKSVLNKDVKTVLVSDNSSDDIKKMAKKYGAIGFLKKKYEPEDLDSLFEMIFKNSLSREIIIN
ncbi:MAG: response regulator [Bdellovibrionota bacterium]